MGFLLIFFIYLFLVLFIDLFEILEFYEAEV